MLQPSHKSNDGKLYAWTLLASAIIWLAMALPFFAGRVYVADDLGAYHLPLRSFYAEQLEQGQSFDWLPSLFSGFYLTGEGQVGSYHPLHLFLYRYLPLGIAFDLELLLSYPAMLAGMYLLLRRWLGRRDVAMFGALIFTFSGFNLLHFVHPNAVAVVAHIPWILWAIDVALNSVDRPQASWALAAVSLFTGSQLLLGYPQYVWFSLLVAVPYAVWRSQGVPDERHRQLLRLALALTIGVLIGGIQLLPTTDALFGAARQTAGAEHANSGSLHPLNLVQFVAPYLLTTRVVGQNTHELGLYIGAVPLLLAVWLLTHRSAWGRWKPLVLAAVTLAVAGLVLAAGEYGLIYRLQQWLPLVGKFRFPCRAIVLVHLAISVLAAIALWLLVRLAEGERSSKPLWIVAACSVAIAVIGPLLWQPFVASWQLVWLGPALFVLGAVLITAAEHGYRGALFLMVLLTAADLGAYGLSFGVLSRTALMQDFVADQDFPPNADGPIVAEPAEAPTELHVGDRLLLAGYRRADGYCGLEPKRNLDYRQIDALRVAGVHWRAGESSPDTGVADGWIEVPAPLPQVRLITRTVLDQGGDFPAEAAALDAALVAESLDLPLAEPGEVAVEHQAAGSFAVRTHCETKQLLVVAESYHPGWQATVNGQPVPVVRVNRDFLGCLVGAGDHLVELRFRPLSLLLGGILSSLGLGLMVCWLAKSLLSNRLSETAEPVSSPPTAKSSNSWQDLPCKMP